MNWGDMVNRIGFTIIRPLCFEGSAVVLDLF